MAHGGNSSTSLLFVAAIILVLVMTWRGWRLGIVRQLLSIASLILSYAAGWLFGGFLIPVLRPLGFPDRVLAVAGGVVLGLLVYVVLTVLGAVLFKRTSQQSVGIVRLGFGLSGALLGAVFGLFLVLVAAVGLRLVGSAAEAGAHPLPGSRTRNALNVKLAELKHSLSDGACGAVLDKIDPIPGRVYDTLGKLGELTASPESMERFARDREVQRVSSNPKVLALRDDPDVVRAVQEGDFMRLLRNPKVIEAANDPDVQNLLARLDFQKVLDRALHAPPRGQGR